MSYKEKPIIKLYAYKNNAFELVALIDDYQEASIEHNYYQAGQFTITINYNIPNAKLFDRGLFVQLGDSTDDFGEITSIQDSIGDDGKGSQRRLITGYDARYLLKRRIIKNLNSNGMWKMTAKGELCLRNLIADQCGANAETKRQLPIINTIPATSDAIGEEYSVSEQFTNLYDVCCTIATQSKIGWKIVFAGSVLTLECYEGEDLSNSVFFSTDFESLKDGTFTDTSDTYTNAVYIGGKGQNDERDIYEGEDGSPAGIGRFESWDDQSQMTSDEEYEAEALSMLSQYGQTVNIDGNGLAKSPYIFRSEYDIGDSIKINFSDRTAVAQILSVTERWAWSQYDINFSFGKPQNNLAEQIQLMLRKIQMSSNNGSYIDSVKWYTIPTDTEQTKADVTFNTLGFTGTMTDNATFTLYADDEGTGSKDYNIYVKNLSGNFSLTLTTGKEGATDYVLQSGTYNAQIYIDEEGNIIQKSITPINAVTEGSKQTVTSGAVAELLANPEGDYKEGLLNFCYPVGSLYWTSNVTFDPNVSFGGTWTRIKDKFVYAMGDNDTLNATGGAKTVTLDYKNLPDHHHVFAGTQGTVSVSGGNHNHGLRLPKFNREGISNMYGLGSNYSRLILNGTDGSYATSNGGNNIINDSGNLSMSGSFTPSGKATGVRDTSDNTFTQTAIDKMPPYICKICWERTA